MFIAIAIISLDSMFLELFLNVFFCIIETACMKHMFVNIIIITNSDADSNLRTVLLKNSVSRTGIYRQSVLIALNRYYENILLYLT